MAVDHGYAKWVALTMEPNTSKPAVHMLVVKNMTHIPMKWVRLF